MDDPWGSPWASTDQEQGTPGATLDLPLNPKTPHLAEFKSKNDTLSFSSIPGQSPWAYDDDSAFGDWETPVRLANTTGGLAVWGGAALGAAEDQHASESPPLLDATEPDRPKLTAWLPVENATPTESSVNDRFQGAPDEIWNTDSAFAFEDTRRGPPELGVQHVPPSAIDKNRFSPIVHGRGHISALSEEACNQSHHVHEEAAENTLQETQPYITPSRPSSPKSEDSRNIVGQQESPTTSVDDDTNIDDGADDARNRSPAAQRTTSAKVQGLVELYDGLCRLPGNRATMTASSLSNSGDEKSPIYDAEKLVGEELRHQVDSCTPEPRSEPSREHQNQPLTHERTGSFPVDMTVAVPKNISAADGNVANKTTVAGLLGMYGRQVYAISEWKVGELFSSDVQDKSIAGSSENGPVGSDTVRNDAALDSYIPDSILVDSFTGIGERKAWYRISRQGSYRKHNAGDDENYRPVLWATSTVRIDTVKIVRRWMEEDSFTGKPTLGGSSIGGNMFGWDSAAKPVALDEIFKKKRSGRAPAHKSSASAASAASVASATSVIWHTTETSAGEVFGWQEAKAHPSSSSVQLEHQVTPTRQTAFSLSTSRYQASKLQPLSQQSVERASQDLRVAISGTPNTNDDEEWGEMVFSPTDGDIVVMPRSRKMPLAISQDHGIKANCVSGIVNGLPDLSYMAR